MKINLKDAIDGSRCEYQVWMRIDKRSGKTVMEFADGKLCGSDCWILGQGAVVMSTEAEAKLFAKWIDQLEPSIALQETIRGIKK